MASEIRVDKINSLSGVGTVTLSPTGVDIAGITTASTLRATTGIITTLQVGTISGDGSSLTGVASTENIRTNTNATFLQNVNVSGTSTIGGDVNIADKIVHIGDTNTAIRFPEADTITFEANGFEQVRIDNDVQMFIEGDSKIAKLQLHREDVSINAGDVVGQIAFTGRDQGGAGIQRVGAAISAIASNNWDTGQTTGYSATHLDFYTQAQQGAYSTLTPRLRIDSSGRVLMGGATSSHGSSNADDLQIGANNQGNQTGITLGSASASSIRFADASDDTAGQIYYSHSDDTMRFTAGSSERVRIDANGIKFNGDSAAANALDDYEEGTFTAGWFDDGGVFVSSYSVQYGQYTKIGNVVYFCLGLRIGSFSRTPNSSQFCRVGNLPFVSRVVGDDEECVFNLYARLWGSGTPPETARLRQSSGGSGSNHIEFFMDESQTGNDDTLQGGDFSTSDSCRVVVNGFYYIS